MRPASLLYHCLRVLGDFMLKSNDIISDRDPKWQDIAQTYLQPHYGNGVFGNVYLLVLSSWKVNIAVTPLP